MNAPSVSFPDMQAMNNSGYASPNFQNIGIPNISQSFQNMNTPPVSSPDMQVMNNSGYISPSLQNMNSPNLSIQSMNNSGYVNQNHINSSPVIQNDNTLNIPPPDYQEVTMSNVSNGNILHNSVPIQSFKVDSYPSEKK